MQTKLVVLLVTVCLTVSVTSARESISSTYDNAGYGSATYSGYYRNTNGNTYGANTYSNKDYGGSAGYSSTATATGTGSTGYAGTAGTAASGTASGSTTISYGSTSGYSKTPQDDSTIIAAAIPLIYSQEYSAWIVENGKVDYVHLDNYQQPICDIWATQYPQLVMVDFKFDCAYLEQLNFCLPPAKSNEKRFATSATNTTIVPLVNVGNGLFGLGPKQSCDTISACQELICDMVCAPNAGNMYAYQPGFC